MNERQRTAIREQCVEGGEVDLALYAEGPRVQELEAENARLKSLVGELLVTNQLLREGRAHRAEVKAEVGG